MAVAERESLTPPSRWPFGGIRIRSSGDVAFLMSSALLLVFCFFAIWPQALATYDPTINNLGLRHEPPGVADTKGGPVHFLGTDHMGRDEWSRLVWGARASMTVGGLGLLLGAIVGVSVGLAAGFRGGWVDRISMRVVDIFLSFPYILIAIVWASLIGTDMKSLILIVGVRGWVEFARITRAQAMALREREYVTAARALGAHDVRIVFRHILPNTFAPILVVAGYELGRLILLEATLSFLTIGIRPPTAAWGSMLSDARNYMNQAWWTVLFPGMFISLIVMAGNFLGDSLRDKLDPTLRGRA